MDEDLWRGSRVLVVIVVVLVAIVVAVVVWAGERASDRPGFGGERLKHPDGGARVDLPREAWL